MQNILYTGDNLFILSGLDSQSVDLIYLDPPFNSKRIYSAPIGSKAAGTSFKDMWTWADVNSAYLESLIDKYPSLVRYIESISGLHSKAMMAYITYMTQRIIEMYRVLKDTGSLYLHVDPTASHYLKLILDEIFGKQNFRNEIVWHYEKWTSPSKFQMQKNHDIILYYSKGNCPNFSPPHHITDNLKKKYDKGYLIGGGAGSKGLIIYDRNNKKAQELAKSGRYIVRYADKKGKPLSDVWALPFINPMSKERTGYPTQKPLALLERIIKASSQEGDVVLDPFCGCATTCVKAQQLGRKWIGIDIEKKTVHILLDRLSDDAGMFKDFIHTDKIPQRSDVELVDKNSAVKERLYKQQSGLCNGCQEAFKIYNFEIDHIVPKSKGGGDYYENYQLLCGNCNRVKGNRPMEYLRMKIKAREALLSEQLSFGD